MKRFLAAVLACLPLLANAVICHTTPTTDDLAFYDRAIVASTTNLTWDGYNANVYARTVIDYRRSAFATLSGVPPSGPLTDEEAALWDDLLVAADTHGVANLGNANGQGWTDGALGAQWAHGLAWVSMYYRKQMRC